MHHINIALSVILIAAAALVFYWCATAGRSSWRKINRLERQLGMRPSYDVSRRRRRGQR